MAKTDRHRKGEVLEKPRAKTAPPRTYKVLLHNDDYTTMDFVIDVLESIFERSPAEAYRVMMQVHNDGIGVAGIYPYEIAETKVHEVHQLARAEQHPLRASLEEDA